LISVVPVAKSVIKTPLHYQAVRLPHNLVKSGRCLTTL